MKLKAFLQLVRWPNLVFIILTQVAFYYFVMLGTYGNEMQYLKVTTPLLLILILASVCIAAGGNIINDYFDINIDVINKPSKVIIGNGINKRYAILLHFILSFVGVSLSFYISYALQQSFWWLGWCNLIAVFVLIFYSASLKKKLLTGNIVIAVLTAWVIVVLLLSQFRLNYTNAVVANIDKQIAANYYAKLVRIGLLYAAFAFIITLIREVVKDMEDVIGDTKHGCRTMPIVWGLQVCKVFVAVWSIVLVAMLLLVQFYVLQYAWYFAILYCLIAVIVPLIFTLTVLAKSFESTHFHTLSTLYKYIMLTGILSMIFFKIYA